MEVKSLTKLALFFNVVSYDINFVKFLAKFEVFFGLFLLFISALWKVVTLKFNSTSTKKCVYNEDSRIWKSKVGKEDISIVMCRLGISGDLDNEMIGEFDSVEDVLLLMDGNAGEEEDCVISFEDVRDAFDVFDSNKDGFIDEMELQRVLNALGIQQEDSTLVQCRRMINKFDENGDGFIDFDEFVALINICF